MFFEDIRVLRTHSFCFCARRVHRAPELGPSSTLEGHGGLQERHAAPLPRSPARQVACRCPIAAVPAATVSFVGAFFTTWLTIWPAICGFALGITTSLLSSNMGLPLSATQHVLLLTACGAGVIHLIAGAACATAARTMSAQNRCGSLCWSRKSRCGRLAGARGDPRRP